MTLAVILAAVAALCLGAQILSAALAARQLSRGRRPAKTATAPPPISVVQPLSGLDRFSEETMRAILTLDYPDYEVVFCVASARDPIVPLARRMMESHPERAARLLFGVTPINANPKLNNFAKGWEAARHPWIAVVDANLLPPRDYLHRLVAAWRDDTGVVSAPPVGVRPDNFAAEIECAFLNGHEARWQIAGDAVGLGFAQGKTLFFRRDIIERGGGMAALGTELAEDAAATKVVRRQGLKARLAEGQFGQPLGERTWSAVWSRQVRWARLRRASFARYYALEICTALPAPALAATGAAILSGHSGVLAFVVYVALWRGVEAALCDAAGWKLGFRQLAAATVRDVVMPWLWVQGWIGHRFEWHGHAMSVAGPTAGGADDERHAAV